MQLFRDETLIANFLQAEQWSAALWKSDEFAVIAARNDVTVKYLGQMLLFVFLLPKLVRVILEGRQPPALTA